MSDCGGEISEKQSNLNTRRHLKIKKKDVYFKYIYMFSMGCEKLLVELAADYSWSAALYKPYSAVFRKSVHLISW